jgi:hypothetical protein
MIKIHHSVKQQSRGEGGFRQFIGITTALKSALFGQTKIGRIA